MKDILVKNNNVILCVSDKIQCIIERNAYVDTVQLVEFQETCFNGMILYQNVEVPKEILTEDIVAEKYKYNGLIFELNTEYKPYVSEEQKINNLQEQITALGKALVQSKLKEGETA